MIYRIASTDTYVFPQVQRLHKGLYKFLNTSLYPAIRVNRAIPLFFIEAARVGSNERYLIFLVEDVMVATIDVPGKLELFPFPEYQEME